MPSTFVFKLKTTITKLFKELGQSTRVSLVIEVADLLQLLVSRPLKVLPCSGSLSNHLSAIIRFLIGLDLFGGFNAKL